MCKKIKTEKMLNYFDPQLKILTSYLFIVTLFLVIYFYDKKLLFVKK